MPSPRSNSVPAATAESNVAAAHEPCTDQGTKAAIQELNISWVNILKDIVHRHGGTEPAFVLKRTDDSMFKATVSFGIQSGEGASTLKCVRASDMRCSSISRTESEAAAAALDLLRWGPLGEPVVDISYLRCAAMGKMCEYILDKSKEISVHSDIILEEWRATTKQIDHLHSVLDKKATENMLQDENWVHRCIINNTARALIGTKETSEVQLENLRQQLITHNEAEQQLRIYVKEKLVSDYNLTVIDGENKGIIATQVQVSKKLLLLEMMKSLGWQEAQFFCSKSGGNIWTCTVKVSMSSVYSPTVPALFIEGANASSEQKAMENAAENAISYMEEEWSICVIDLNHRMRAWSEQCMIQAEKMKTDARTCAEAIMAGFEKTLKELQTKSELISTNAEEHADVRECEFHHSIMRDCAEAAICSKEQCEFAFEVARGRHIHATSELAELIAKHQIDV